MLSQLKRVIRTNYSNPPTHGGSVVAAVLASPELRATWEQELGEMRDRIRAMRNGLVERLKASGVDRDFSFVNAQRGMFSYSGLTAPQVDRLREEFGIYAVSTGRICVAALNTRNLDVVANADRARVEVSFRARIVTRSADTVKTAPCREGRRFHLRPYRRSAFSARRDGCRA